MKLSEKIVISVAITIVIAIFQAAFRADNKPTATSPGTKIPSQLKPDTYANKPEASRSVKTQTGQIFAGSNSIKLIDEPHRTVYLTANFAGSASEQLEAQSVTLELTLYLTSPANMPDMSNLILRTGNKTMYAAPLSASDSFDPDTGAASLPLVRFCSVPFSLFNEIVNYNKVEIRVGDRSIKLTGDQEQILREFADEVRSKMDKAE
jgi:hypothetical protein